MSPAPPAAEIRFTDPSPPRPAAPEDAFDVPPAPPPCATTWTLSPMNDVSVPGAFPLPEPRPPAPTVPEYVTAGVTATAGSQATSPPPPPPPFPPDVVPTSPPDPPPPHAATVTDVTPAGHVQVNAPGVVNVAVRVTLVTGASRLGLRDQEAGAGDRVAAGDRESVQVQVSA